MVIPGPAVIILMTASAPAAVCRARGQGIEPTVFLPACGAAARGCRASRRGNARLVVRTGGHPVLTVSWPPAALTPRCLSQSPQLFDLSFTPKESWNAQPQLSVCVCVRVRHPRDAQPRGFAARSRPRPGQRTHPRARGRGPPMPNRQPAPRRGKMRQEPATRVRYEAGAWGHEELRPRPTSGSAMSNSSLRQTRSCALMLLCICTAFAEVGAAGAGSQACGSPDSPRQRLQHALVTPAAAVPKHWHPPRTPRTRLACPCVSVVRLAAPSGRSASATRCRCKRAAVANAPPAQPAWERAVSGLCPGPWKQAPGPRVWRAPARPA
jgi:hypothetical protein